MSLFLAKTLLCTELLPQAPTGGMMEWTWFVSGMLGSFLGKQQLDMVTCRVIPTSSALRAFWSRTVTVGLVQHPLTPLAVSSVLPN